VHPYLATSGEAAAEERAHVAPSEARRYPCRRQVGRGARAAPVFAATRGGINKDETALAQSGSINKDGACTTGARSGGVLLPK
jgi:hypothetical protein